jgi:hypothetical protein
MGYIMGYILELQHVSEMRLMFSDNLAKNKISVVRPAEIAVFIYRYTYVTNLMVESAACMSQNLLLKLIQSLFLIYDGKSAACMLQN